MPGPVYKPFASEDANSAAICGVGILRCRVPVFKPFASEDANSAYILRTHGQ